MSVDLGNLRASAVVHASKPSDQRQDSPLVALIPDRETPSAEMVAAVLAVTGATLPAEAPVNMAAWLRSCMTRWAVKQRAGGDYNRGYAEGFAAGKQSAASEHSKALARVYSHLLRTILEDRLSDGTPVIEVVLGRNPGLATRLREVLG